MTFQTSVNVFQAPAVEGAFASRNPRFSKVAGEGQLVTGVGGVTVGRFAWVDATNTTALNTGIGEPDGFVANELQANIQIIGQNASMLIPEARAVTLFNGGDFWVRTATIATRGQKIFASLTDGSAQTGAPGATIAGFVETKWFVTHPVAANELVKMSSEGK